MTSSPGRSATTLTGVPSGRTRRMVSAFCKKTEPVRVPSGVSIWAVIISMGRTSVLMRPMVASDVRPVLIHE